MWEEGVGLHGPLCTGQDADEPTHQKHTLSPPLNSVLHDRYTPITTPKHCSFTPSVATTRSSTRAG